eukprot:TRINITY_DN5589_c0_g1_i1.p1 TRINITY_DN5589_c0_g1~~TRINITY_DN5589_c0_g1_i1.p1  ORF type:complete len:1949 (-),score=562.62 TRINITY_DN5589_c0_g1_i1:56-5902(-)
MAALEATAASAPMPLRGALAADVSAVSSSFVQVLKSDPHYWAGYEQKFVGEDSPVTDPMLMHPPQVVQPTVVERVSRYAGAPSRAPVELKEKSNQGDLFATTALKLYSAPWMVIKDLDEQFQEEVCKSSPVELLTPPELLTPLVYEQDSEQKKDSGPTTLDSTLLSSRCPLDKLPSEGCRQRFYHVFPLSSFPVTPKHEHAGVPQWSPQGISVLVDCKALQFDTIKSNFEPFFISICLFDGIRKEKLSENFTVEVNDAAVLASFQDMASPSRLSIRRCVFHVDRPDTHVVLCVQLSKILKGDYDAATEPYCKALSVKEHDKFLIANQNVLQKLKQYRQIFAYGCVPLGIDNSGSLKAQELKIPLVRTNTDLPNTLIKLQLEKEAKKLKYISGRLVLGLTPMEGAPINDSIDSALMPLLPFQSHEIKAATTREAQEFPLSESVVLPHVDYTNFLYFYPESLNFNNYKGDSSGRNLALIVKLLDSDALADGPGIDALFGDCVSTPLVQQVILPVSYHNKKPKYSMFDEVKIFLPPTLTPKHHLLVKVCHVDCKVTKKSKVDVAADTALGVCVIPLLDASGNFLPEGKHSLPLSYVPLCQNYLCRMAEPNPRDPLMRWIDNGKPIFQFRIKLVSSVISQDIALNRLFTHHLPPQVRIPQSVSTEHVDEADEAGAPTHEVKHMDDYEMLDALSSTSPAEKVKFFPLLVTFLVHYMQKSNLKVAHKAFIALVNSADSVAHYAQENGADPVLESYLDYMYQGIDAEQTVTVVAAPTSAVATEQQSSEEAQLHMLLVTHLISLFEDKIEQELNEVYRFSWFLFGLITKDMTLYLQKHCLLEDPNREKWFSATYKDKLKQLLMSVVYSMHVLRKTNLFQAREFNREVSFFLRDLLGVIDRGFAFQLIHTYVNGLSATIPELAELKWLALRIICYTTPQYVALNLPCEAKITTVKDIFEMFCKKHFLAGLLLSEIENATINSEQYIRYQAIELLRDLLIRHDHDTRYQADDIREKVANLYFPFVLLTIEHYKVFMKDDNIPAALTEFARQWLGCLLYIFKDINANVLRQWWRQETPERITRLFTILSLSLEVFAYPGKGKCADILSKTEEEKRLTSSGITASACSPSVQNGPATKKDDNHPQGVRAFKQRKESHMSPASAREAKLIMEERYGKLLNLEPKHQHTNTTLGDSTFSSTKSMLHLTATYTPEALVPVFQNLNHECCFIVLRVVLCYLADCHDLLHSDEHMGREVFTGVFQVLVQLFSNQNSDEFLHHLFTIINNLIHDYSNHLFKSNTPICGGLTRKIMDQCNSVNPVTRGKATALLHNAIMENFRKNGNFSRMKLQSTIAISQMVVNTSLEFDNVMKSLDAVAQYMKEKKTITVDEKEETSMRAKAIIDSIFNSLVEKHFKSMVDNLGRTMTRNKAKIQATNQIKQMAVEQAAKQAKTDVLQQGTLQAVAMYNEMNDLKTRLFNVIEENMKMRQWNFDPEKIAEIYHNLSLSFRDSPDLRVTWLENLANKHIQLNNFEESAQTKVVTAGLASAYLFLLAKFPFTLPDEEFLRVFPNWQRENHLPPREMLASVKDDICLGQEFTFAGWEKLLRTAVLQMEQATLYESSVETFQLLLPLFRHHKDYFKQSQVYLKLHELCDKIVGENLATGRIMSNYYRAAFYGKGFGPELDGKEYIYKETSMNRLGDIKDRLLKQYTSPTRPSIEIFPNTKEINVDELDPTKCYIQLGAVVPYWPLHEKQQKTLYEQHFNISNFLQEMPFTESGAVHAENLADQCKKKIIYTVDGSFPYLLKRLPIIANRVIKLTPIENAREAIQDKIIEFEQELTAQTISPKTLQMKLNGALLACVNAGPLEVARVFLGKCNSSKYPEEHVIPLESEMLAFDKVLVTALKANLSVITGDQRLLQDELEKAQKVFHQTVLDLVGQSRSEREALKEAPALVPSPMPQLQDE